MWRWLSRLFGWTRPRVKPSAPPAPLATSLLLRLERVILAEGVARTLFDDYASHRRSERGDEEIGWVLLGIRQGSEAIAVAALPAGAERDAGQAHVQFNSEAQALASRILRQTDKRLTILGVVHTHPGSMRYPSGGDLHGDGPWVASLRGGEGVFAIGTADALSRGAIDPVHMQAEGERCFSWYALGADDVRYRPLAAQVAPGGDLAQALRPAWNVIEAQAAALNTLCRLFAKVELEASDALLKVRIALPTPGEQLHLLLSEEGARYYWSGRGETLAIDLEEAQLDRAVYLILAELAKGPTSKNAPLQSFA